MADDYAETHDDDDDPFILDSEAMNKVLSDCHVSEEKISRIEKSDVYKRQGLGGRCT